MNPLKVGVVGCGVIGSRHIEAAAQSSNIELTALADLRVDLAQEIAAQHEGAAAYREGSDLIVDPNVEAVVLAMPAHLRTDLALAAFAAGKHVLTEKPVAMNAAEVKRMIAAQGDLVAACCSARYRFLESSRAATDFIASGALGRLRVVRCRALHPAGAPPQTAPPAWRLSKALNGGGILMNWGCYDLDYLLGITGWSLQPETVLAQTWKIPRTVADRAAPGSDAETHIAALIRCAGNVAIHYERAEFAGTQPEDAWQIAGENGTLHLQMTPAPGKRLLFHRADHERGVVSETIWQGEEDPALVHAAPVEDFAGAVRTGHPPKTSLEQAYIVQAVADAIYASAEQGGAVNVVSNGSVR